VEAGAAALFKRSATEGATSGVICTRKGRVVRRAPFLESLPAGATPAAEPAADPRKSRPAIRSPSATCGRLDRRKILRRSGDIVGPARGLRVGCQGRGCREQNAIATESVTLRIDVSFYCRDVPLVCPKPVDLTRSAVLVHIDDCSVWAALRSARTPMPR